MHFNIRPSKCFLYETVQQRLTSIRRGVGLDAGSANFKHRSMFKTDRYYGIDLDVSRVKAGLKKDNDKTVFGIHADLSKLERLPIGSAAVIASTNTLYCLSQDELVAAIGHLCRIVSPAGLLICELPIKGLPAVRGILKKNFRRVDFVFFKNIFSQAYEWIFEKNGYLGSHPIAGTKPFRLLAWLLSRLEYLTCRIPWLNRHVLVVCYEKNDQTKHPFDLSGIPQIEDRLYDLMA